MNVDQKTVVLTALVDFLVEQHYVNADDVTEDLLDQLILQRTGTWQFQSQSSVSTSSGNSMLTEQEQEQQQQHNPSAVRIATQTRSGVCTIFETSHLSLGWTWESDACFAVQLHLGSGCSAGSDREVNNGGICRVVHSVDAISAAPSTRGFSNNDDAEESLPLWVRDALQIQIILDPVECVVTDSNRTNNSNNSQRSPRGLEFNNTGRGVTPAAGLGRPFPTWNRCDRTSNKILLLLDYTSIRYETKYWYYTGVLYL